MSIKTESLSTLTDAALLKEIGERLRRARLNRNLTQAALAKRAGIARRTVQKAEEGESTTLQSMVAILRGLDLLEQLDQFLPAPPPSPVQLAKLAGKNRQRASSRRTSEVKIGGWNWKE